MITIANRYRPFSHRPGVRCVVPGTHVVAEVFPTLLRLYEGHKVLKEIPLEKSEGFTLIQDLERGCLTLPGKTHLLPSLELAQTKHPHLPPTPQERLSFGVHKKQDWDLILKRGEMREILPFWHRLGILTPPAVGTHPLLEECAVAAPEKIIAAFARIFRVCFAQMLVPRLQDQEHQGISDAVGEGSPFGLLTQGAVLIRSLFLYEDQQLHLLPRLPPECFSGRFVHVPFSLGEIAIEWTKKEIRKVEIHARQSGNLALDVRHQKTMRFQGERISCSTPLVINSNQIYVLDRFEK